MIGKSRQLVYRDQRDAFFKTSAPLEERTLSISDSFFAVPMLLQLFKSHRHAEAAGDADGGQTVFDVALVHFVNERGGNPGAGAA